MPTNEQSSEVRPQERLPADARTEGRRAIPIKVRIVGTPSSADLDKLTASVARAVGKQLRAAQRAAPEHSPAVARPIVGFGIPVGAVDLDPKLRPVLSTAEMAEHAKRLEAKRLHDEGPTLEHRWRKLATFLAVAAARAAAEPESYLALSNAIATLYRRAPEIKGATAFLIDKQALLGSDLTADDVAELDRIFTSTGFAPQGDPAQDWYVRDDTGRGLHIKGETESEIESAENDFRGRRRAAIRAQSEETMWGLLSALAGVERGSTSAAIVRPRAGAADGPPRVYTPKTGPSKQQVSPYTGLLPPRSPQSSGHTPNGSAQGSGQTRATVPKTLGQRVTTTKSPGTSAQAPAGAPPSSGQASESSEQTPAGSLPSSGQASGGSGQASAGSPDSGPISGGAAQGSGQGSAGSPPGSGQGSGGSGQAPGGGLSAVWDGNHGRNVEEGLRNVMPGTKLYSSFTAIDRVVYDSAGPQAEAVEVGQLKALNFTTKSYVRRPRTIVNKLVTAAGELETTNGVREGAGHYVLIGPNTRKVLDVAIPAAPMTDRQKAAFDEARDQAASIGILVRFHVL